MAPSDRNPDRRSQQLLRSRRKIEDPRGPVDVQMVKEPLTLRIHIVPLTRREVENFAGVGSQDPICATSTSRLPNPKYVEAARVVADLDIVRKEGRLATPSGPIDGRMR